MFYGMSRLGILNKLKTWNVAPNRLAHVDVQGTEHEQIAFANMCVVNATHLPLHLKAPWVLGKCPSTVVSIRRCLGQPSVHDVNVVLPVGSFFYALSSSLFLISPTLPFNVMTSATINATPKQREQHHQQRWRRRRQQQQQQQKQHFVLVHIWYF